MTNTFLYAIIAIDNEKEKEMMEVKNHQGLHMKDKKAKNRETIVEWFKENNFGSMKQCSDETEICYATVRAHVAELRNEQDKGGE